MPAPIKDSCDENYNKNPGDKERWQYLFLVNYIGIILYSANLEMLEEHYAFYGHGKKQDSVRWIGKIASTWWRNWRSRSRSTCSTIMGAMLDFG